MKHLAILAVLLLSFGCTTVNDPAPPVAAAPPAAGPVAPSYTAGEPRAVTLDSQAPLITIRVMVTHGSTSEPQGKDGLAGLTAEMITDGGYRTASGTMTKEQLAELTMPWGSGARPTTFPAARTTTFFFTAPREVIGRYVRDVLRPMLNEPLFEADELDRLKNERLSAITALRTTDLENLGLAAIDQYVLAGTSYEHDVIGTQASIPGLTRDDVIAFYRDHYRPENIIVGISTTDQAIVDQVKAAVRSVNRDATTPPPPAPVAKPAAFTGRHAVVIEEPNAPAASVHAGFPISVSRTDADFWPLYVANVYLGTHRDSFGQLYQKIREERGYNYGDYSYVEYWAGRPSALFQLFNQPREQQYFSLWVRPVKHEHAVHMMKAVTYELDQMVRNGLTAEQVEASKNKARVLYLNLAETVPRLISARVDDAFYGMEGRGFLDSYLQNIDRVSAEQVNAAIRRHLRPDNVKYVVVTSTAFVQPTVDQLRGNAAVFGKTFADYEFTQAKLADGTTVWQIPEAKVPTVQLDAAWANYPLNVREVTVGHVNQMFAGPTMLK
ncbi:MAG TPA: pitrilysin family protein [Thermoanaerobaculia bacterium]|nr:pitrilysin family protein [Thermoanaerobaculia bacterium]